MEALRLRLVVFAAWLLVVLAACGGETAPVPQGGSATLTGTLAYVVTECRETSAGFFFNQKLMIRQAEHDPITALEIPDIGPLPLAGYCGSWARLRGGFTAADFGVFQRLAVSSDGSEVAFEITDAFSLVSPLLGGGFLPPEQTGFFLVRADGTDLRPLGPPSRQAAFAPPYYYTADLAFSPNGRMIAFPDLGPGPGGEEASQIFVLQLASGSRTQVTQLPPASPAPTAYPLPGGAGLPGFLDDETVGFYTEANPVTEAYPDGINPTGDLIFATVHADGSGGLTRPPSPVVLEGSQIDPRFVITGGRPAAVVLSVPGPPVNPRPAFQTIFEIFFYDGGQNLLQLTDFHRIDTGSFGGDARQRVFFTSSADPLGTNPSNNCQIFSIASLGGDLRQLTQFYETDHSTIPCGFAGRRPYGCNILAFGRDTDTGALVFASTCDPFGTNPNGEQYFVVGADGAGLRQLTNARGLVNEPDGTVIGELPDPSVYSGARVAAGP